ncbi:MAG: peptidase S41 [Crocinitomicaceae bacterium]|nr:peptidase S41 [Crocinitomicaceae bacterium]
MKIYIIICLLFIVKVCISQETEKNNSIKKFNEVISHINNMYVDEVENKLLTEAAIIALMEELDPHSTYLSIEDVQDANERINGNFVGIGIRFQILKDTLNVVATIPGGPSEKIGILAGDKIILIENKSVAGIGLKNSQVRKKLLGEKGSKVSVGIKRKNKKSLIKFTITRDVIPINSVDATYMLSKKTGYIKLNTFSRTSHNEVINGIKKLKKLGMKNLIFDLQGNGGGLLYTAKFLGDEFLSDNKLIVYSEGRVQPRSNLSCEKKGNWENGKLIILTDEYSASASEILSGAIQDWDRGLIIGRRTFGKGLVQRPINLTDGSQLRLTIARYYTPSGRYIQKPYEDANSYRNDLLNRYENGEFTNQDSIKLPDSLKYKTLKSKRTVYGGGGIMPDYFVPLDTSGISDYYTSIISGGHLNSYILTYVNNNREQLRNNYPTFKIFKNEFIISKNFMDSFFNYIESEDSNLKFDENGYLESKEILELRIKAMLAQNLWGYDEFYQIYNQSNEALQKAIEIIETNEYYNLLSK